MHQTITRGQKNTSTSLNASHCSNFYLLLFAGECEPPSLAGGVVSGQGSGDSWVGVFSCRAGTSLVGEARLKCRNGVWSSHFPVCVGKLKLRFGLVFKVFPYSHWKV